MFGYTNKVERNTCEPTNSGTTRNHSVIFPDFWGKKTETKRNDCQKDPPSELGTSVNWSTQFMNSDLSEVS